MAINLAELPWLVRSCSSDVRRQFRNLQAANPVSGRDVVQFANQFLNADQLIALARTIDGRREQLTGPDLTELRLVILSTSTTDFLKPALVATAIRHKLLLKVACADYGQVAQEAFSRDGLLASAAPEAVLLALDRHFLGLVESCTDGLQAASQVQNAEEQVRSIVEALKTNFGVTVLLQTIPIPADPWMGHLDSKFAGALTNQIAKLNDRIVEIASETQSILIDVDRLSSIVGRSNWIDHKQWFMAKLAVAMDNLPLYADHIARTLAAMRGKTKKCLVLDLDNTLWGGVIADDGLGGIALGQGSADGEAFLAVQQYALELKRRGIILAVCSKNDEVNARLPFESHPEMLLKSDDIAIFVANWTDKATNLRAIAEALNIGIDSLVFLDDNPAERSIVRREVPDVAVPEVTDDAANYPMLLAQAGYFDTVSFTSEDLTRTDLYLRNAKRVEALKSSTSIEDFLLSLEMVCEIREFDVVGRARIMQLINKSNQYNLTTRRYTEAQVEEVENNPDQIGLQVRLIDRFGDNGMISVVIVDKKPSVWTFDTWLMSCRVLGRKVENAVLSIVVRLAKESGVDRLLGTYIPSPKNSMVKGHYEKLGFAFSHSEPDGTEHWELDLSEWSDTAPLPMRITGIVDQLRVAEESHA